MQPSKRKRHKLDLSPISVDEALSNPALSGIERTLCELVARREPHTTLAPEKSSQTLPPPQNTTGGRIVSPTTNATHDERDIPIGELPIDITSIGDIPSSELHTGVTPIGISFNNGQVGNVSKDDPNPLQIGDQPHPSDTDIPIGVSPSGDIHPGDSPIGANINHPHKIAVTSSHTPIPAGLDAHQPGPFHLHDHTESPIGASPVPFGITGHEPGPTEPRPSSPPQASVSGAAPEVASTIVPHYRQKVRAAIDVQDGHSTGRAGTISGALASGAAGDGRSTFDHNWVRWNARSGQVGQDKLQKEPPFPCSKACCRDRSILQRAKKHWKHLPDLFLFSHPSAPKAGWDAVYCTS